MVLEVIEPAAPQHEIPDGGDVPKCAADYMVLVGSYQGPFVPACGELSAEGVLFVEETLCVWHKA